MKFSQKLSVLLFIFLLSCSTDSGTDNEKKETIDYTQIAINEFIAKDDVKPYVGPEGNGNDWIELYNKSNKKINIAGMYVTDKPDSEKDWQQIPKTNSAATTIPAKGFLVLVKGATTEIRNDSVFVDIGLKAAKDHFVALYDPKKTEIDKSDDFGAKDGINLPDESSFGRSVDGGGVWEVFAKPTPNASNETN